MTNVVQRPSRHKEEEIVLSIIKKQWEVIFVIKEYSPLEVFFWWFPSIIFFIQSLFLFKKMIASIIVFLVYVLESFYLFFCLYCLFSVLKLPEFKCGFQLWLFVGIKLSFCVTKKTKTLRIPFWSLNKK